MFIFIPVQQTGNAYSKKRNNPTKLYQCDTMYCIIFNNTLLFPNAHINPKFLF